MKKVYLVLLGSLLLFALTANAFANEAMQVQFDDAGQAQFVRSTWACSCGSLIETVSVETDVWFRRNSKVPCNAHYRYDHQENTEVKTVLVKNRCPWCCYEIPYEYKDHPYSADEIRITCEAIVS